MLTGKKLGPYKLTREAGRGEASTVYEAIDTRIGRTVAVKIQSLPANLLPEQREAMKLRVEREARSIGRLSHPNIVKIYVAGEQGNNHYIVMEYLDGISLRERLDAGPLPPAEAADILDQTAAGLDAVHAQGLVHRDIKPSNIMTMPDGNVKLTDFGVAHSADDPSLTTHGMMIGSPSYMSPEQAQGEPATPASDIWGLGALLYHMLVGKPPFAADTVPSLLYKIVHEEPILTPAVPPEIAPVLRQALDKNPALRFPSARALAAAFREALGDATTVIYKPVVPAAAVAVTGPKILGRAVHSPLAGFTPRVPRPLITPAPRRTRGVYQAAAAIALLALGGTSLLLAQRGREVRSAGAGSEGSTASASLPEYSPSATTRPSVTDGSTRPSPESATPPGPRQVASSGVKPGQTPAEATPAKTNPVRILSAKVTPSVKPSPTASATIAASVAAAEAAKAGWQIGELLPPETTVARAPRPSPTPEASTPAPPPARDTEPKVARRPSSPTPRPTPPEEVEPAPVVTEEEPPVVLTEEDAPPPPDAPDELRELLNVWIDMTNERDVEEQMRFYAPHLARFYLDRNVSRSAVSAEKARIFGDATRVEMKAGDPRITFSPDGNSARMVFRKQYLIRNQRETRRGAVQQELRWKLLKDGWKIVSERDLSSEK